MNRHVFPHIHKDSINKFILAVAVLEPATAIPQAIKIFYEKTAEGVSLTYWGLAILFAALWLWYGIYKKEAPIIIASCLWLIIEIVILIGVVLF